MTSNNSNECIFGGYENSSQITNEMNMRIYNRNVPSHMLQPYLSVRPVMTKYSFMPIVDPRAPISVPMEQQPVYNVHTTFNPGNTQSPWSGFASNINNESILRNQVFALQNCSQSVYVPSSDSDLYQYSFKPEKSGNYCQPFPGLFRKEHFNEFNPNIENIGDGIFMNHTRQQLLDLTFDDCGYVIKTPNQEQTQNQGQKNPQQQNQTMAQVNNKK
jgi:hypothetical protein